MQAELLHASVPRALGESLRAARERGGMSLSEAASKLRIDAGLLGALEDERFAELGAPVYVRGHLRRYADLLGLAYAPLQALYDGHSASIAEPDLTQAPRITDWRPPPVYGPRPPRRRTWRLVVALGLLAVACLLWWGLGSRMVP